MNVHPLREAIGSHLGQVLTPEVAAEIELAARSVVDDAPGYLVLSDPTQLLSLKVNRLAETLLGMPPVDCPVRHHFSPGLYAREITIPTGTLLIGARHKQPSLVIVSRGRLVIATDNGPREVCAGDTLHCAPGMQNAAYAIEETQWTNIWLNANDETDTDKLVESIAFIKASEVLGGSENAQLLAYAKTLELER